MACRARRWIFTINNYSPVQAAFFKSWKKPLYLIVGKEVAPTTGTPHLQGYVALEDSVTPETLQRLLTNKGRWPYARTAIARGNADENQTYCGKDNLWVEWGTKPAGPKPKRGGSDAADAFRDAVRQRTSVDALWETHAGTLLRNPSGAAACITHYANKREKPVPVILVAWGETGTGKSRWAAESFGRNLEDVYWVSPGRSGIWWGGYSQQHTVVFDDFTPSQLPLEHFKLMCDRYSYRVEGKGTQVAFTSRIICFTSNVDPATWYEGEEPVHHAAIQRRIKGDACSGNRVMEFDGVQTHHPFRPIKAEIVDLTQSDDDDDN